MIMDGCKVLVLISCSIMFYIVIDSLSTLTCSKMASQPYEMLSTSCNHSHLSSACDTYITNSYSEMPCRTNSLMSASQSSWLVSNKQSSSSTTRELFDAKNTRKFAMEAIASRFAQAQHAQLFCSLQIAI